MSSVFMKTLEEFFREIPKAALAFSGGVDSAYLLYEARRLGCDVRAYYVKSAFQPLFELEDAKRLAAELGAELTVLEADVLSRKEIADNPSERCYFCKSLLFGRILQEAQKDGFSVLMDGTNASDDCADRPGMRAARELSVRSPLRECGLSKTEIRRRSREAGLFTWDKPAYACLATRIPYGTQITGERLEATEAAEDFMMRLGFRDFRVRLIGDGAKIQLREEQLPLLLAEREHVLRELKRYYKTVTLDLEVRA